ncbi:ligase-associated DNA damage response endonuclease PdeM [Salinisphaera sp. Q1T1-3]|uniref:ligase-associated DNA damage response endonuclease PdeM n=1 Tax=Salinisphaera sp. Q1T1-3 TaxID=2321229 RepID=UPI000E74FFDE|nr:ligase-associated DNA damage response endonuclease PdeM [Salinisphaera sp. Q1T1-3]RJS92933.1 ligase-associated DNA damage response endonuclease PdeM [Salinisphaera sp. Q1T1-3]
MPAPAEPMVETANAELCLAGERLVLRADHSVYWSKAQTLFVADTHFGKSGVFRQQGVNVPSGTTEADLARLEAALAETGARRLVVLGDFVHAPPAADAPWLARFADWRARHASVEIIVTRGNHDRIHRLPVDCDIDWQPGARCIGPFVCQHEPGADARGPVLAGHVHPVVRLGAGTERARLPVFWRHDDGLMLPAFCSFAGGGRVSPKPADQVFVAVDGEVIAVPLG